MVNNTGGPAFPGLHPSKECHYQDAGMTLRDYFAAKVLPQCLGFCSTNSKAAEEAYKIADAMLAAREQK